jgi:hypothetical protein
MVPEVDANPMAKLASTTDAIELLTGKLAAGTNDSSAGHIQYQCG